MKNIITLCLTIAILLLCNLNSFAQPYTLDKNVIPEKLELLEDKNVEGAKGIIKNATIEDEDQYFFIKGHDMFQFVDVYIMANYGDPSLTVDLAYINWNDVEQKKTTTQEEDGIINFKLRVQDAFGIRIYATDEPVNYTIAVYASAPRKEYLGTLFRKATQNDLKTSAASLVVDGGDANNSGNSGSSNMMLYIILGIALLIIGFLAAKLLGKNKNTTMLLLFLLTGIGTANAQMHNQNTWDPSGMDGGRSGSYGQWLQGEAEQNRTGREYDVNQVNQGLKRLGKLGTQFGKAVETYRKTSDLYDQYNGLGNCMSVGPPPGMPTIPSFCETGACEQCFSDARASLDRNRYTFEQMRTIYKCSKNFTNSAIAFGNNVSGYHGVSGMAWQSALIGIKKSVKELETAYDKKYIELLASQKIILQ
ncbi:MAG: hypothetical protein JKY22_08395, partial [Flavobacteriaceae bacterium]|nr:hypothetical protein [Flavobacteriaceae bacterium]